MGDRRLLEEALTFAARTRLLAQAERIAGVGSWAWHVATNQVVWSDEMYRIFGVDLAHEDLFAAFTAGIHPDDRARIIDGQQQLLASGATAPAECRVVRPDGSVRLVRLQGTAIVDGGGAPERFVGTVHDLTDLREGEQRLRRLEEQLFQAQKLEALGRLASGIAHDFNNILAVLQLAIQRPQLRADLETAIERGATLTRQLLAFGRKSLLQPRPFDVSGLLRESVTMVDRLLGDAVTSHLSLPKQPLVVLGDPVQLQHVVINLMINARDAMPNGGTIWVTARARLVGDELPGVTPALAAGEYVELEIRDEGTGIADDDLPHIFEPFFTTKAVGKGTGMGLASVFGLVSQSGGGVGVTTEAGAGTTFRLYLPRTREPPRGEVPAAEAPPARSPRMRVLVVDDHQTLGRALTLVLEDGGYVATYSSDAPAIVRDAGRIAASVDLVITDLDMPGRSGLELARALWTYAPGLPVLFMSGHAGPAALDSEQARTAFLAKPFSAEQLLEQLALLLA